MELNRKELMDVLAKVKPGLAKKSGVKEQSVHFIFTGEHVATYNGNICIVHPLETGEAFSVRGDEFYKILSGIREEEIDLQIVDDTISITTEKTKAGMSTVIAEGHSVEEEINDVIEQANSASWKPVPKRFIEGIYMTMFSAAKEPLHVLSCIMIDGRDLYSSDILRASYYQMDKEMKPFLLPARNAAELVNFPVTHYYLSEGWVYFKTADDVLFCCDRNMGEYGEKVDTFFTFSKKEDPISFTLPESLKEEIDSLLFLSEDETETDKYIIAEFNKGKIKLKGEKRELGWVEKTIDFKEYKGKAFKITINPAHFSQILSKITEAKISEIRALFATDDFKHVISLPVED